MTTPLPFVTAILPIRNEARFIKESLDSVLAQDYPSDRMEILVADGMSNDGTREIVREYQATHANVRLLDNPGRIVSTGLNRAIAEARGEVLARIDGHCHIASDYIRRSVAWLQSGFDGVGGPIETIGETTSARAIAVAMSSRFGVGDSAFRTVTDLTAEVDTVAFPAYTRHTVHLAGPFDEELVRNQDDEYNYRLRKCGARILLAADVRSRYYSRSSLRSLWRQYFQYGFWKVRVMQKHPRQMRARQFVPPLFAAALIGSLLLTATASPGGWMLLAVAGAYLLANLCASLTVARAKGFWVLPVLPAAYAIIHLSYGLGFLTGFARFWNRWTVQGILAPQLLFNDPRRGAGAAGRS